MSDTRFFIILALSSIVFAITLYFVIRAFSKVKLIDKQNELELLILREFARLSFYHEYIADAMAGKRKLNQGFFFQHSVLKLLDELKQLNPTSLAQYNALQLKIKEIESSIKCLSDKENELAEPLNQLQSLFTELANLQRIFLDKGKLNLSSDDQEYTRYFEKIKKFGHLNKRIGS